MNVCEKKNNRNKGLIPLLIFIYFLVLNNNEIMIQLLQNNTAKRGSSDNLN